MGVPPDWAEEDGLTPDEASAYNHHPASVPAKKERTMTSIIDNIISGIENPDFTKRLGAR